jgi:hypothetical protein
MTDLELRAKLEVCRAEEIADVSWESATRVVREI